MKASHPRSRVRRILALQILDTRFCMTGSFGWDVTVDSQSGSNLSTSGTLSEFFHEAAPIENLFLDSPANKNIIDIKPNHSEAWGTLEAGSNEANFPLDSGIIIDDKWEELFTDPNYWLPIIEETLEDDSDSADPFLELENDVDLGRAVDTDRDDKEDEREGDDDDENLDDEEMNAGANGDPQLNETENLSVYPASVNTLMASSRTDDNVDSHVSEELRLSKFEAAFVPTQTPYVALPKSHEPAPSAAAGKRSQLAPDSRKVALKDSMIACVTPLCMADVSLSRGEPNNKSFVVRDFASFWRTTQPMRPTLIHAEQHRPNSEQANRLPPSSDRSPSNAGKASWRRSASVSRLPVAAVAPVVEAAELTSIGVSIQTPFSTEPMLDLTGQLPLYPPPAESEDAARPCEANRRRLRLIKSGISLGILMAGIRPVSYQLSRGHRQIPPYREDTNLP